jgi:hypothetical protein
MKPSAFFNIVPFSLLGLPGLVVMEFLRVPRPELNLPVAPRLVKTGGRLVKYARYNWLLPAEGHLHRRLFGQMLRRIWALPVPSG